MMMELKQQVDLVSSKRLQLFSNVASVCVCVALKQLNTNIYQLRANFSLH